MFSNLDNFVHSSNFFEPRLKTKSELLKKRHLEKTFFFTTVTIIMGT